MPRPAYSNFVRHCMRFYAKYPHPVFGSEADIRKWRSCDDALKGFSEQERELLISVFSGSDDLSGNICRVSEVHGMDQDHIWHLVYDLERKIAQKWGMI